MSISTISPLMQKAFRDGKQLYLFADLWTSALNDTIDSQSDFQASVLQSNMDFTTSPGYARLTMQAGLYNINQTSYSSWFDFTATEYVVQRIRVSPGRKLSSLTVKIDNTGSSDPAIVSCFIHNGDIYGATTFSSDSLVATLYYNVSAGYIGNVTFTPLQALDLADGDYSLVFSMAAGSGISWFPYGKIAYQNTDVYADGGVYTARAVPNGYNNWVNYPQYDLFFSISLSGYISSGYFITRTMDLEEPPPSKGTFQIAADIPAGTSLTTTLYGSATGAFSGEETIFSAAQDGQTMPTLRYWRARCDLTANASLDQTPLIDMLELYYPDDRVRFRQKDAALRHVNAEILRDFSALLTPGSMTSSELKPIERVSSLGTATITLEDATPDYLQRIVANSPLKNFRAALYLGADVPGFGAGDLFRYFIGIVEAADIKPKFRDNVYTLNLSIKNPILDLKRKIPMPDQRGLLDFEIVSINHDGLHVIDSILDLIRGKARIPARYIDIASFSGSRTIAGSSSPAPQAHVVRRSNSSVKYSDGTDAPDTRIKSPEELSKLLIPLCIISDGYIVTDEGSRLKFVHHDTSATYEETWADEALVRDGLDAVPIETMGKIDLGYSDFLYNLCYCGCEWDGSGSEWGKSFKKIFASVDATSADEWAPGKASYISPMEKSMLDVSKWLGPEAGYNGETLAQAIADRMVARYAYPPVRITGIVLPLSQFVRGLGAFVRIWSSEFAKFKRRGIALSETIRFIITKQVYDQRQNKMIFDVMEVL